jgi:DNA-binding CsgD family transcriptional regulator
MASASLAFREAAAINRELHETGALRWCAGGVALAEGMAGNDEAATAAVAELDGLRADWMMIFEPDLVDRGRAWARVAGGAVSSACQLLRSAADRAAAVENWVAEARLLHDLARLGDPRGVATRLSELAEMIDGELVQVMAAHAGALVGGAGDDLEAASHRFEELGAALLAAEAATAAAAALKAEGSSRRSTACARRAAELVQVCGFPHTPGLTSHVGVSQLSKRELEVAGLAVRGKTNREIAEGLFVSVRTVQNHLQNVYGKLGVSNREELARVFTPR